MILCKYGKTDSAVFVPHLDVLRAVTMAFRRTGIPIAYSEGYNPHMQLFFNQPLPIGTASECEYFCAHSDADPDFLREKLNGSLPSGVRILCAGRLGSDPNVAKIMYSADYTVTMRDVIPDLSAITDILKLDRYEIAYSAKGKDGQKDVRPLILDLKTDGRQTLFLRLRCGNENLRADRLAAALLPEKADGGREFDIVKTAMFDRTGKNLDDLFFARNPV